MLGREKSAKDQELIKALQDLAKATAENNKVLKQLAQDNSQFLSTLTSFMAHEDVRRMRKEARDEEDALSKTPTKHDAIY